MPEQICPNCGHEVASDKPCPACGHTEKAWGLPAPKEELEGEEHLRVAREVEAAE